MCRSSAALACQRNLSHMPQSPGSNISSVLIKGSCNYWHSSNVSQDYSKLAGVLEPQFDRLILVSHHAGVISSKIAQPQELMHPRAA